jgi:hypothetical protein
MEVNLLKFSVFTQIQKKKWKAYTCAFAIFIIQTLTKATRHKKNATSEILSCNKLIWKHCNNDIMGAKTTKLLKRKES